MVVGKQRMKECGARATTEEQATELGLECCESVSAYSRDFFLTSVQSQSGMSCLETCLNRNSDNELEALRDCNG